MYAYAHLGALCCALIFDSTDYIIAYQQGSNVLAHEIESSLNALFKVPRPGEVFSFTWNHITPQGEQTSWCFCFGAEADYEQWRVAFAQGLYENLTGIGWAKVPVRIGSVL